MGYVTLTPCTDLSAADWLTNSDLPWTQLVTLGPAGFAAYARLRFIPDPAYGGQSENDVELDDDHPSDRTQLHDVLALLTPHTTTPNDWYVAYWDGWGAEMFPPPVLKAPVVRVPNREYFLLRGDAADLMVAKTWPGYSQVSMPGLPAFVWPTDRAWCVTADVDPHWAGIGADRTAIYEILTAGNLDVVPASPGAEQPHYW
jgi:hypothetical protein